MTLSSLRAVLVSVGVTCYILSLTRSCSTSHCARTFVIEDGQRKEGKSRGLIGLGREGGREGGSTSGGVKGRKEGTIGGVSNGPGGSGVGGVVVRKEGDKSLASAVGGSQCTMNFTGYKVGSFFWCFFVYYIVD